MYLTKHLIFCSRARQDLISQSKDAEKFSSVISPIIERITTNDLNDPRIFKQIMRGYVIFEDWTNLDNAFNTFRSKIAAQDTFAELFRYVKRDIASIDRLQQMMKQKEVTPSRHIYEEMMKIYSEINNGESIQKNGMISSQNHYFKPNSPNLA